MKGTFTTTSESAVPKAMESIPVSRLSLRLNGPDRFLAAQRRTNPTRLAILMKKHGELVQLFMFVLAIVPTVNVYHNCIAFLETQNAPKA